MRYDLTNKVAIITGGASGIGAAIARVFAEQGATVHILDIDLEGAHDLLYELRSEGHTCRTHLCDTSRHLEVAQVIKSIAARGAIHILINNAAIAHIGNLESTTEADLDRIYRINVKGVYNCMHAVIAEMKASGGVIVNIASIAATVGLADRFAYSMSKGAVLTMTYSVAKDYVSYGIRCNSISPARIHTPFVDGFVRANYAGKEAEMFDQLAKTQPIGRMGRPEEVASLALYLCSDEAAFVTGTDFPIDGGFIKLNG